MGGVTSQLLGVVTHPLAAHDVEGRGVRESSQVNLAIKHGHHVGDVPGPRRGGANTTKILANTVVILR